MLIHVTRYIIIIVHPYYRTSLFVQKLFSPVFVANKVSLSTSRLNWVDFHTYTYLMMTQSYIIMLYI